MSSRWTWIAATDVPKRADVELLRAIEAGQGNWEGAPVRCSRSQLQRLMEEGRVLAQGKPMTARDRVSAGAEIEIAFPEPAPLELVPENRPIDLLYQDEHLLVLNKPPGLTVHPSTTQTEGTLVHALLHHIKDLSGIGGKLRPGIVHRIDKNTSGALVITKSDAAHQKLTETFAKHEIERAYWAICYGTPAQEAGRIESLIGRSPNDRKKMSMQVEEGRNAITHWKRTEEFGVAHSKPFASLIEARLETGRTHQVRVHLTGLGHGLLGDPTYGTPTEAQPKWKALPPTIRELVKKLPGQALHARVLGFDHPITGEKLRFEAAPPAEFATLLAALRAGARV